MRARTSTFGLYGSRLNLRSSSKRPMRTCGTLISLRAPRGLGLGFLTNPSLGEWAMPSHTLPNYARVKSRFSRFDTVKVNLWPTHITIDSKANPDSVACSGVNHLTDNSTYGGAPERQLEQGQRDGM